MSAQCALEADGDGCYRLIGEVGFDTVADLLDADSELFAVPGDLTIDLSGVTEFDSAGLALLIRWLSEASREARGICFANAPDKVIALATISDVEGLFSGQFAAGGQR